MRVPTLNSYIKEQFLLANNKSLSFKIALERSKTNKNLAVTAQAYFLSTNDQSKANEFSRYTKVNVLVSELESSSLKPVKDFFAMKQNEIIIKRKLRDFIAKEMKIKNLTFYKIAKLLQTSQSNIDCFFKKNEFNKLSLAQLEKLKTLI